MTDQFDRIIDRSHQTYEQYGEEYRRLNRLIIGFSVGAIAFVGSMFAPSAGRVSWLMTTALTLYLLSAWLGLTVEYTVLARLENRLKNFLSVFLARMLLRSLTTSIWKFHFPFFKVSPVIFHHGSSTPK